MLNKEVKFIKKSNDTFLAFIDGSVLTIQSDNVDKIVLEANAFFEGKIISKKLSICTREIIKYLCIKEVQGEKKNNFGNYTVIDEYSPNDILNFHKITDRVIVNVHGFILVIPRDICVVCAVRRLLYREYKIYKYEELWNVKPLSIYREKWNYNLEDMIRKADLDRKVTIIKKKNGDVESLNVICFPDCKLCGAGEIHYTNDIRLKERSKSQAINGSRSRSIIDTYKNLKKNLYSLGPIIGIEYDDYIDKLKLPVYQSEIGINPLKQGFRFHGGKGYHRYQAMFSAIGEALERYNSQFFNNECVLNSSYRKLIEDNKKCLNPRELILDENYPIKYSEDLILEWVIAKKIRKSENVLVPANIAYFVYTPNDISKEFIPQDTTGLASGMEIEDAILQGIQEIIERDAYAIYFRGNFVPYSIDINSLKDKTIRRILKKLSENNIQVFLTYLKTDLNSYVIHCVTYSEEETFPIYTHGAGASLNPNIAIIRAITECVQLRVSQIKIYQNKELFSNDTEYVPYITWGNGERECLGNLINTSNKISLESMPNLEKKSVLEDIKLLVESLHVIGYETYVVNLSRSDNAMKTVRVIIPGLQPADDTLRMNLNRYERVSEVLNQPFNAEKIFKGEIFS